MVVEEKAGVAKVVVDEAAVALTEALMVEVTEQVIEAVPTVAYWAGQGVEVPMEMAGEELAAMGRTRECHLRMRPDTTRAIG